MRNTRIASCRRPIRWEPFGPPFLQGGLECGQRLPQAQRSGFPLADGDEHSAAIVLCHRPMQRVLTARIRLRGRTHGCRRRVRPCHAACALAGTPERDARHGTPMRYGIPILGQAPP
jgi:hypothetical protein